MAQRLHRHASTPEKGPGMRYPIIFIILAVLFAALPMEKAQKGEERSQTLINTVLNDDQQQNGKEWLDEATAELRGMKPTHQLLVLSTFIILTINAAIVVSYIVNSIAAITGIGFSLAVLLPFLLIAIVGLFLGWRAPREALKRYMKDHAEFGPFVSRLSTHMWKRRFRRAAREHGWAREY